MRKPFRKVVHMDTKERSGGGMSHFPAEVVYRPECRAIFCKRRVLGLASGVANDLRLESVPDEAINCRD